MDRIEEYPYFIVPAVEALRGGGLSEEEEARCRRLVAANVGDTKALRLILGIDPGEFSRFYPDMSVVTPTTSDTIDSFLSHFGDQTASIPSGALEIQDVPASDYLFPEEMEAESGDPDPTTAAIDSFLAAAPTVRMGHKEPAKLVVKAGETEQKASELIKNRDYQGALEIIQRLSLNNPEKSVYFADQIRFLKKLLLNQARINNNG